MTDENEKTPTEDLKISGFKDLKISGFQDWKSFLFIQIF
jgi:hypothetical protein